MKNKGRSGLKKFANYIREFGFKIFISKTIRRLFYKSNSRLSWEIDAMNERLMERYLTKEIEKDRGKIDVGIHMKNENIPEAPIWVMWWQGEESAPEVVRLCINSIRKNSNGHEVILVTENTLNQYISLPAFVLDKVRKGVITVTHLSDLIRLNLLYLYGGAWIDATVFVSQPIPEELFQSEFYSVKTGFRTKEPSHGRWTTFLLFGKEGNRLFKEILECHYRYWISHDMLADYIMFDYIINYVIKHNKEFYHQIDAVPQNNRDVFELKKWLNLSKSASLKKILEGGTIFHKLSWKDEFIKEMEGKRTVYAMVLERYGG